MLMHYECLCVRVCTTSRHPLQCRVHDDKASTHMPMHAYAHVHRHACLLVLPSYRYPQAYGSHPKVKKSQLEFLRSAKAAHSKIVVGTAGLPFDILASCGPQ